MTEETTEPEATEPEGAFASGTEHLTRRRERREELRRARQKRFWRWVVGALVLVPSALFLLRAGTNATGVARARAAGGRSVSLGGIASGVENAITKLAFWRNGPVRVRLRLLTPVVPYGQAVGVMGSVSPSDVGDEWTYLEERGAGGRWDRLATLRLSKKGVFDAKVVPRQSGVLRVRVGRRGLSKTVTVILRPVATMETSGTAFWHRPFHVKGAVRPARRGTRVVVQVKMGARWVRLRETSTDAAGAYSVAWKPKAVGQRAYRALVPKAGPYAAAVSRGRKIKTWYMVALTFDDGPFPPYTEEILRTLKRYRVQATFFVLGQQVQAYPELVNRAARQGNLIGNHSWNHATLTRLGDDRLREELKSTSDVIAKASGKRCRWMRPPGGATDDRVNEAAHALGMKVAIWDLTTVDWEGGPSYRTVTKRALEQVQPSDMILMHDGGGDRSQTARAINYMVQQLKARNYLPVTLDEIYPGTSAPDPVLPAERGMPRVPQ